MSTDLKASYAWCRRIARRSASNFYYSFLMLPRAKRSSMCALYAFLRRTDDLGDSPEGQEVRREALGQIISIATAELDPMAAIRQPSQVPRLAETEVPSTG